METVKKYKLVDGKRFETGTYERDSEWEPGDDSYIVGINNQIVNSEGKILVQQRSLKKKNNPGKWSSTNGLVALDENPIDTVIRETQEELGISIDPSQIKLVEANHIAGSHLVVDIFVTLANPETITIQETEVEQIKFVSPEELLKLDISTTCSYIRELLPRLLKTLEDIKQRKLKK